MMVCVARAASIWLLGSRPRILDEGSLYRADAPLDPPDEDQAAVAWGEPVT
jgi:hypothetical protein